MRLVPLFIHHKEFFLDFAQTLNGDFGSDSALGLRQRDVGSVEGSASVLGVGESSGEAGGEEGFGAAAQAPTAGFRHDSAVSFGT